MFDGMEGVCMYICMYVGLGLVGVFSLVMEVC